MAKSHEDIKSQINNRSFEEEVEYGKKISLAYLNKEKDSKEDSDKAGIKLYKRALMLIGSGNLEVLKGGKQTSANQNKLSNASYLAHGARIVVQIPAGSGDDLFNWLCSGDPAQPSISNVYDTQEKTGKEFVYPRRAGTHGTKVSDDYEKATIITSKAEDKFVNIDEIRMQHITKETKGFLLGATSFVQSYLSNTKTPHYGIDLSIGVDKDKDLAGNLVNGLDMDHGHLYMCYKTPTKEQPGVLLFGIEASAPRSSKHSKLGASDPFTAFHTSIWEDLDKKNNRGKYAGCIIGEKYNGRFIQLTKEELSNLLKVDVDAISPMFLINSVPQKSVKDFIKSNEEYKKQSANYLSLFKQEFKQYNADDSIIFCTEVIGILKNQGLINSKEYESINNDEKMTYFINQLDSLEELQKKEPLKDISIENKLHLVTANFLSKIGQDSLSETLTKDISSKQSKELISELDTLIKLKQLEEQGVKRVQNTIDPVYIKQFGKIDIEDHKSLADNMTSFTGSDSLNSIKTSKVKTTSKLSK
jgi:hypothetical protein